MQNSIVSATEEKRAEPVAKENAKKTDKKSAVGKSDTESAATADGESESGKIKPIEINGDQVEFIMEGSKVIATGNVVVVKDDITLTCDRLEFLRDQQIGIAEGHVILHASNGEMRGEKMTYNFKDMNGEFAGASFFSDPFFGRGETMEKLGENHMRINKGYLTTCDLDKPHFRMSSKKTDIYPGQKAVSRNVKLSIGEQAIFFLPRLTQDLRNKKPQFTFMPGSSKEWGLFLLTQYRYQLNDSIKGILHLDAREKKDIAWGIDVDYDTKKYGEGVIRTYYMNERSITSKRFYQPRPSPTIEKERFKAEWRHKWAIDKDTNTILQYYRLSDRNILKDYFEREHQQDSSPPTYFLLTRGLPLGTLSFRMEKRVNRFVSAIQRLPEIQFSSTNQELANTNVYLKSTTTYSNLSSRDPNPTEVRRETMRTDSENILSYPLKVSILEVRPFIGARDTYYSKTKDVSQYNVTRHVLLTGSDLSTRFYKVFDVKEKFLGIEINRLRHIVNPSIAYVFNPRPTITSSVFDQFDAVDSIVRNHYATLSLENKLQTKRDGISIDLLRVIVNTDFRLKEHPGKGGFDQVRTDWEFRPSGWFTLHTDTGYDTFKDYLTTANFDLSFHDLTDGKWYFNFGKRYNRFGDDQITTDFMYTLNPKWKLKVYERFDINGGLQKEQEFRLIRDLHCWNLEMVFHEKRGEGDEILFIFTLKEFPEMGFNMGSSFNQRKAGSQSSE